MEMRDENNGLNVMTTTSTSPFMSYAHMNDVGVALIQQNCFLQAFDTFRETVQAMKDDVTKGRSGRDCPQTDRNNLLIENAKSRLLSLDPFPCKPSIQIAPISCADLINSSDGGFLHQRNLRDSVFIIRADNTECTEQCYNSIRDDMSASIAMYNFGIAHLLYYSAIQKMAGDGEHLDDHAFSTARRLLTLALAVLEKHAFAATSEIKKENLRKVLILRMIVLFAFRRVAVDPDELDIVNEELTAINMQISSLNGPQPRPRGHCTPAA